MSKKLCGTLCYSVVSLLMSIQIQIKLRSVSMHTDETDRADDNGSLLFYLLVIREKENLIRCHRFIRLIRVPIENTKPFSSCLYGFEYLSV